jgi:thiol-disulfide isomerase/thioredoxin
MALTLPDLEGRPQAMAQWRGKVLVVNYWASWCAPCVEEMPAFSRLQGQYAAQGVQFVGIGIDEVDNMRTFVKANAGGVSVAGWGRCGHADPGSAGQGPALHGGDRPRWATGSMSRLGRLDEARLEPILQRLSLR